MGEVILAHLLERELTRSALMRRCGLSGGGLANVMSGNHVHGPAMLAKLAGGLGLTVAELEAARDRVLAVAESTRAEMAATREARP